ncbi:hypothetical protein WDU94_006669 [Cyamophila willieti]
MYKRLILCVIFVIKCRFSYQVNFDDIELESPTRQYRTESLNDFDELIKLNSTVENTLEKDPGNEVSDIYFDGNETSHETTISTMTDTIVYEDNDASINEHPKEILTDSSENEIEYNDEHTSAENYLENSNAFEETSIQNTLYGTDNALPGEDAFDTETSTVLSKVLIKHVDNTIQPDKNIFQNHKMEEAGQSDEVNDSFNNSNDEKNYEDDISLQETIPNTVQQNDKAFSIPPNLDTFLPKTNAVINNTFKTGNQDGMKDISGERKLAVPSNTETKEFQEYTKMTPKNNNESKIVIPKNLEHLLPSDMIKVNQDLENEDSLEEISKRKSTKNDAEHNHEIKLKPNSRFLDHNEETEPTKKPYSVLSDINSYQILSLLQNRIPRLDGVRTKHTKAIGNKHQENSKQHIESNLKSNEHQINLKAINTLQKVVSTTNYSDIEEKLKDKRDHLVTPKTVTHDHNSSPLALNNTELLIKQDGTDYILHNRNDTTKDNLYGKNKTKNANTTPTEVITISPLLTSPSFDLSKLTTYGTKFIPTTEYFTEIPGILPTIPTQGLRNHKSRRGKELNLLTGKPINPILNYTKEQYEAIKAVNLDKIILDLIKSKNLTTSSEQNLTVDNVISNIKIENDKPGPSVTDETSEKFQIFPLETDEYKTEPTLTSTTTVKPSLTNDEFKMNLIRNIIRDKVRSKMRLYAENNSKSMLETVGNNGNSVRREKRSIDEKYKAGNSINDLNTNIIDEGSDEDINPNEILETILSFQIEENQMDNLNLSKNTISDVDTQNTSESHTTVAPLQDPLKKGTVFNFLADLFQIVRILSSKCTTTSDDNSTMCIRRVISRTLEKVVDSDEIIIGYDLMLVKSPGSKSTEWNEINSNRQIDTTSSWWTWYGDLFQTMIRVFQTHRLRFRQSPESTEVTGRHRHYYKKVFPIVVGSYMIISAFLIPLGFQFMAMLGGKALILSKLALLMGSIGLFRGGQVPHPHGGGGFGDWGWPGAGTGGFGGFAAAHKKNSQGYEHVEDYPLPLVKTDPLPLVKTDPLPLVKTDPLPLVKTDPLPLVKTDPLPLVKTDPLPLVKTDPLPLVKTDPLPLVKTDPLPLVKTDPLPLVKTDPLSELSYEDYPLPLVKTDPLPLVKTDPLPLVKTDPLPLVKTDPLPLVKTDPLPLVKTDPLPLVKTDPLPLVKTDPLPLVKTDPLPLVKTDPLPLVKTDPLPLVKTDPLPLVKTDPLPLVKTDPLPLVKTDPLPLVKNYPSPSSED